MKNIHLVEHRNNQELNYQTLASFHRFEDENLGQTGITGGEGTTFTYDDYGDYVHPYPDLIGPENFD